MQQVLPEGQCYILNIWPYMVYKDKAGNFWQHGDPCNDESTMLWSAKSGFTEYGLAQAEPTLSKIRSSSANVIVTFGAQALELATGQARAPILKMRGSSSFRGNERVGGKKVVCHYSSCCHSPRNLHMALPDHCGHGQGKAGDGHTRTESSRAPHTFYGLSSAKVLEYIETCRMTGRVAN